MRGEGSLGGQKLDPRADNLLAAGIESHRKWDQHATHCERYTLHYRLSSARRGAAQNDAAGSNAAENNYVRRLFHIPARAFAAIGHE